MLDQLKTLLLESSRPKKRGLLLVIDIIIISFILWLSFSVRLHEAYIPTGKEWLIFLLAPAITIPVFIRTGLYRSVLRYIRSQFIKNILIATLVSTILLAGIINIFKIIYYPPSVISMYWLGTFAAITTIRYFAQSFLYGHPRKKTGKNILVYGAGSSGVQLAPVLASQKEFNLKGFIDDDESLKGWSILDLPVMSFAQVDSLLKNEIDEVILAMPSEKLSRRQQIIQQLAPYPVKVRTLPALVDFASGKIKAADIRDIDINDLLGRQPVTPDPKLLPANITGKSVMVSGAGGSIGSELCRQILKLAPTRLVLFELSEFALYSIEQELEASIIENNYKIKLNNVLGSISNQQLLERIFKDWNIQTIYHAAAYKHVPLVEENPSSGIANNIFGTKLLAEQASKYHVETFILISTDKAVRPTNVMGCTKRISEMVLQALAKEAGDSSSNTVFSMVRFGNVLGSSGSVVPKFREQIAQGGPITVTHRDITRYFMSIPEAVQLVIQAGAMAKGGEVFVLDMGDSVKITDLAEKMVLLSGLELKNEENPEGEIEIQFTGLRPGEKLYEELLIGDNVSGTSHPRIMQASETHLSWSELKTLLETLNENISTSNIDKLKLTLTQLVDGYNPWKEESSDSSREKNINVIHMIK